MFFSGSECGCFHSLCLFSLHGLIKVSAAQSVLYNPDVLLIMSSRATPKKTSLFDFLTWKCTKFETEQGPRWQDALFPSCYGIQSKKIQWWHCLLLEMVFGTVYALSMYSVTRTWSMVFLASTIISSQALSCYRDSCWQVRKYVA